MGTGQGTAFDTHSNLSRRDGFFFRCLECVAAPVIIYRGRLGRILQTTRLPVFSGATGMHWQVRGRVVSSRLSVWG